MQEHDAMKIHQILTELVQTTGREDVGVGEVSVKGDTIHFTLMKGHFTHEDELPVSVLEDRNQARVQMNSIVFKISKQVEREHLEHAAQS